MKKLYVCTCILIVTVLPFLFSSLAQVKPMLTPSFRSILHQDMLAQPMLALQDAALSASQDVSDPSAQSEEKIDPNLAEYYYQQGLLSLQENGKQKAVEYLKYYAKIGSNSRQKARASQLVAENE
jgi:hypothetical protein